MHSKGPWRIIGDSMKVFDVVSDDNSIIACGVLEDDARLIAGGVDGARSDYGPTWWE